MTKRDLTLSLAIILMIVWNAQAIIIRDDTGDSEYLELGKKFPAVGQILPRAGVATLIAPQWAVTAAHVAQSLKMPASIVFEGKTCIVQDRIIHPDWKEGGPNDIALLKLGEPVQGVVPVALYEGADEAGQVATLVGSGGTGTGLTGRQNEDGKKRGATNKIENADHDWLYFTFDQPPGATDLEGISGPGDSGGPALLQKDGRWFVAGISVWGDSAGKTPGMYGQKEGYTRVSTQKKWLADSMSNSPAAHSRNQDVTTSAETQLPNTDEGRMVAEYIEAFNSGDDAKMDQFQIKHMAPDILQKRPREQRMAMYHNLHGDVGKIQVVKVLQNAPGSLGVVVRSSTNEFLRLDFSFTPNPPRQLAGISVTQSEGPQQESTAESMSEAQLIPSTEKYIEDLVSKDDFSGVVLIARGGKPVFQKAYGLASKQYNIPNKIDTRFNLGSINKIFTQAAIAQLAKEGKLKLDDTIDRYLPDFPKEKASKITIRQLLDHRSGVGDFFGDRYVAISKSKLRHNNDFIQLFADTPLQFEPGTNQKYSNGGYVLLGAIIQKVSGQDYYDYIREHVYKPLGMANTDSYAIDDQTALNLATGYTRHGDDEDLPATAPRRSNVETLPARGSAAGGGYSTAEDLLKFALAVQNQTLPLPPHDGESGPHPAFGFAGGAPGINASIETFPAKGYIVIVLSNYDPPAAVDLSKKIGGWIQNLK